MSGSPYSVLPEELLSLIRQGESVTVEFKKSASEITKDVYDTVCSFSNRDGGYILFELLTAVTKSFFI